MLFENAGIKKYYYAGPMDKVTRDVCAAVLADPRQQTGWTAEDIANFPGIDMVTGGGYNCRHDWLPFVGNVQQENIENKPLNTNISKLEEESINKYTTNMSNPINKILRGKKIERGDTNFNPITQKLYTENEVLEIAKNIENALNKLPDYKGKVTRSIGFSDDAAAHAFEKEIKIGNVVTDRGFMSAAAESSETGVTFDYFLRGKKHKFIFIIKSKTGKLIQKYSSHPNEAEVLFNKNSSFKITNIIGGRDKYKISVCDYVISMEEI